MMLPDSEPLLAAPMRARPKRRVRRLRARARVKPETCLPSCKFGCPLLTGSPARLVLTQHPYPQAPPTATVLESTKKVRKITRSPRRDEESGAFHAGISRAGGNG